MEYNVLILRSGDRLTANPRECGEIESSGCNPRTAPTGWMAAQLLGALEQGRSAVVPRKTHTRTAWAQAAKLATVPPRCLVRSENRGKVLRLFKAAVSGLSCRLNCR